MLLSSYIFDVIIWLFYAIYSLINYSSYLKIFSSFNVYTIAKWLTHHSNTEFSNSFSPLPEYCILLYVLMFLISILIST